MSVIYKCKECGGSLELLNNGLGKCQYCGATQTLPKDKDEKIQNLLNRANDFRLNCDFDRAIFEYEKVLEINETEPEAHWGLFLSKYGVEYVKDPLTYTNKPTLHRISSVSVFDDIDYLATIKYAQPFTMAQYEKDAQAIEDVMKELLLISTQQETFDIFLSYKEVDDSTRQRTDDSHLAHDLYNELTAQGYKVFFAPKSLGSGLYEPKIYSAIISSKVMLVLGTKPQYFNAVWVKNEWSRFVELIEHGETKTIIPIYRNMEATELPNRLVKYQALDMSNISFLSTLLNMLKPTASTQKSRMRLNKDMSSEEAYLERGFLELEERNFSKANSFFESTLNINPHNSKAYFGKLMVEMKITKPEQVVTSSISLKEYSNFERAVRFADAQFKTTLLQYEQKVEEKFYKQKEDFYRQTISSIHKYKFVDEFENGIKNLSQFEGFKDSKEYISKLKLIIQKITENEEKYKRLKVAEIKKLEEESEEAIIKIDSEKENKFNFIRFWQLLAYLVVGGEAIFLIAGLITTGDFESILAGLLGCILIDLPLGGVWFLVYSIVESQRNKKQIDFEKTKKDRKQAIKYQLTLDKQKTENKYTNIILKEKNEIIEQILGPYENGF